MTESEPDAAAELAVAQRRLRRRMLVAIAVVIAGVGLAAGVLAMCNRPVPEVPEIARPYLWQVNGPGGPSYLFGTQHIGHSVDDLPRAVLAAQERMGTTVLESDLLRDKPRALLPAAEGRARLEEDAWRALADITGKAEGELVTWDTSRLLGAVILAHAPRVEPIDRGLQKRAAKLGKRLVFLEQRSLEGLVDERRILEALSLMLRHRAQFRAELTQLVRRYATGADDGCPATTGPGMETLVPDLNRAWQLAVKAQVSRGGAFVAIGCGHLVGPHSIVEYLRQQGFDVRRIDR